jgi:putative addiction module component (TIGR02574 family)
MKARTSKQLSYDQIQDAALALDPDERELLGTALLCSLEKEPGYDEAWAEEIRRRIEEIDSGTVELVPWEQVRELLNERIYGAPEG